MLTNKKNLKYLIRSDRLLSQQAIDQLKQAIEDFKSGKSDFLILNSMVSVVVLDENNEYVTML